ncbi:MAG: hypothetical protein VZR09_03540 [Candidatus Gastranaerophilaceae bacterium]|nr:hypothetical protein [Candidatus Gastranaerophilaceae bacterium]
MKKIFTICLILGFIATANALPAYSFKLFGHKKADISTTQTPENIKPKRTFKLFKKTNTAENTITTKTNKQKTEVKEEKEKFKINLFKRKKTEVETIPAISNTQSIETYIDNVLQRTVSDVSGTNRATEKIFLHSVSQISTNRQFKKLQSKINKINKKQKLTEEQKMNLISDLIQNYADNYMTKNRIGLVATVAKLPTANQNALMSDAAALNDCADMYISNMQKTYEIGQSIQRLTNNSEKLANSLKTIDATSKTFNKSARAAMTLSNSITALINESGINQK